MGKFDELLAKKKEAEDTLEEIKKEFTESAKEMFQEWSCDLFKRYPGLEYITFTAYTPYFNDGDACTYRSNHEYFSVNTYDCEEFNRDNFTDEEANKLDSEISEFMGNFTDDDIERLFGDHCRVIINKDGVDIEEYDHD